MNDSGGNFADERTEMVSEGVTSASTELPKRRSTRIVQAVPLVVTGVDALGRPFVERTSSLIINCHGCRYQSKHYVLKNMWVTMEIPHQESGQPPRTVRGRVAWIQRPRTVRQLFQVALELEVSGNVWGIAFPPEDWVVFPESAQGATKLDAAPETLPLPPAVAETDAASHLGEAEPLPAAGADNLRVFPSPASTTDASLQLARQVARLVADAKQQIQAAAQEAASQAVSAERRLSFEQWEQKFAAGRAEIVNETARALEKVQQETDKRSREAQASAAEALRAELPHWLAPQLEQLTRDLTSHLLDEALARRGEHAGQLDAATDALKATCQQAEETATWLKTQAENAEVQIAARAETAARSLEATAETVNAQRQALEARAAEVQHQVTSALASAQSSRPEQVREELETANTQLHERLEGTLAEAQDRAAGGLNEHLHTLLAQLQDETSRHAAVLREAAQTVGAEWEQKLAAMRDGLQEHAQKLESILSRTGEAHQSLEQRSAELQRAQQTLADFHAQLEEDVALHRNELRSESQSLVEQNHAGIRSTFDEAADKAVEQFNRQVQELVHPHIEQAEEAIHRLAGGRSLVDAALTMQQDRIRTAADEAFGESLAQFRQNLGSVE